MDSSSSSVSSNVAKEATQLLKDLLNVGKPHSAGSSADTSTASLPSHVKEAMDHISSGAEEEPSTEENGNATISELLRNMRQKSHTHQQIVLEADDSKNSFCIYGQEVAIIPSDPSNSLQPVPGSNKVKINPVVNFDWEYKYYIGHLVAVHRHGILVAYVLRGKSGGVVRVFNRKTAERALLKGFTGRVTDIAFAHLHTVVLGAVDEIGNMFIYDVTENEEGKIDATLLLQIDRPDNGVPSENHRLIWCPYIPEEEDSSGTTVTTTTEASLVDDAGKLLVLTHDEVAEMWNIDMVCKEYGSGPLQPSEIETGYLTINSHVQAIVDAAFSPDGTALATASLDGEVKFFQVCLQDNSPPRCLHQWQPHDGRPVSCLFFLDDHKHPNPEVQFWKFAVTGAEHNREMKIWSCETWSCLQTITFMPQPDLPSNFQVEPLIKAQLDLSANYLILTDTKRKVLYILQIYQDAEASRAHFSSISEFQLTQTCLSLAILDASRRKYKPLPDHETEHLGDVTTGEIHGEEEEEVTQAVEGSDIGVLIKMFSIHTRALQELQIRFRPESSVPYAPPTSISSVSQDEAGFKDPLSDMSMDTIASEQDALQNDKSHLHNNQTDLSHDRSRATDLDRDRPVLLTPDAFTHSPSRKPETDALHGSGSSLSSFTHVTTIDDDPLRTPHTATHVSQLSPSSSVTITPASSRDFSGGSNLGTPTSVPLPPPTPGEEKALTTPPFNKPLVPITTSGTEPHTPPASHTSPGNFNLPSTATQDFFTSSPSVRRPPDHFQPPTCSDQPVSSIEEIFSTPATRRSMLRSTGSSSSASLEVSEILEGAKKPGQETNYEDGGEPEDGSDTQEEQLDESQDKEPTKTMYDTHVWPKPPEVEVNLEARRLAAEAIQRAAVVQHVSVEDDKDESLEEDYQAEDDVQIEEVKEEVVEEEEIVEELEDVEDGPHPGEGDISGHFQRRTSDLPGASQRVLQSMEGSGEPAASRAGIDPGLIQQMQGTMQQMMETLKLQQQELEQLRSELQEQRHTADVLDNIQRQISNLDVTLSARVDSSLGQHSQQESLRLQKLLNEQGNQERQKTEALMSHLTSSVERTVSDKLERTVRDEIRISVVPGVTRMLDPLKDQLHSELAQKLTATDTLLKENISKMVRSRQVVDAIGQAAGCSIQGPVQAACRDLLVPAIDRACQNVFHQVNQVFQRGTQEYSQQLESHMEQVRMRHDQSRDPLIRHLQSMVDAFQSRSAAQESVHEQLNTLSESLEKTARETQDNHVQLEARVTAAVSSLGDSLMSQMQKVVQEEVGVALHNQQTSISDHLISVMRSGTVTPVTIAPDPQQQQAAILQLLRQGQLNTAFQQALSASDLNLVMSVCETVNPAQVFNQNPCPLQQPVLLSLIQQLSADLGANTELKYKYLNEAIVSLDQTNVVTKEHMPAVLNQLCQNLLAFNQANPQHAMLRSMRMLLMMAQSLIR